MPFPKFQQYNNNNKNQQKQDKLKPKCISYALKKTGKYLNESGIALAEVFPIPVSVLGKHWERGKAKGNFLLLPCFSSKFQAERGRE